MQLSSNCGVTELPSCAVQEDLCRLPEEFLATICPHGTEAAGQRPAARTRHLPRGVALGHLHRPVREAGPVTPIASSRGLALKGPCSPEDSRPSCVSAAKPGSSLPSPHRRSRVFHFAFALLSFKCKQPSTFVTIGTEPRLPTNTLFNNNVLFFSIRVKKRVTSPRGQ